MCLTHIPGADEDGDHVWLVLVGMFVLHQLQQLAKRLPLLICTYINTLFGIFITFPSLKEKYQRRVKNHITRGVSMETEFIEDICMRVCGTDANTVGVLCLIMNIQIKVEMWSYFLVSLNTNVYPIIMFE